MTYVDSEKSKHGGKPLELYRYAGTYQTFRYTSAPVPVMYQAPDEDAQHEYIPLATKRSAVQHTTQNDDTSEVTIDLPVTCELVAVYGFQISPPDLYLTIFRGHNPGEYIRYWQGNVENISVVRGTATIRVPSPLASALSADFPNVYYQAPCNNNLGDAVCRVDLSLWSVETAIVTAVGTAISVTPGSIGAMDGLLVGGDALLASGERRMIVSQVGNTVQINYPFANANVADDLVLIAGCDLALLGDCKEKFNNTINHTGFNFIPPDNIFQTGLEPGKSVADQSCLPPAYGGWDHEWTFLVNDLEGNGAPSLSFLEFFYPDATYVSWNNGTGPTELVFSRTTLQIDFNTWQQTWRMTKLVIPGEYTARFDPTNFPSLQRYSVFYRHWTDSSVLGPPVASVEFGGSSAFDLPFTL